MTPGRKLCESRCVGDWNGESQRNRIAVILPSFVRWIVPYFVSKKFTVPEVK